MGQVRFGLALGLVVVLGCSAGRSSDPATTTTRPDAGAQARGELVLGVAEEIRSLTPARISTRSEQLVGLAIFDPLMIYERGRVMPFLAASISADHTLTEYTVVLRDGVEFHDGRPLDAAAVASHFTRLQEPSEACTCLQRVLRIASIDTPDGPDGLRVVFHLTEPDVTFPDLLAGPAGFVARAGSAAGARLTEGYVGTGPFTLGETSAGAPLVLTANPSYWGVDGEGAPLPHLQRLTVQQVTISAGSAAVVDGALDVLQTDDPRTLAAVPGGLQRHVIASSGSDVLLFNNASPPFDDVRARRAVALIADRRALSDRAYEGVHPPSTTLFGRDSAFVDREARLPVFDPERSAALVDELGGLTFTILCPHGAEILPALEHLATLGSGAGMEVTVDEIDPPEFGRRVRDLTGEYEAACYRSSPSAEPDALRGGLVTGEGGNLVFFSDAGVDRLLTEAAATSDHEERRQRYHRVQQVLAARIPLLPLLHDAAGYVYDPSSVAELPRGLPNLPGTVRPALLREASCAMWASSAEEVVPGGC